MKKLVAYFSASVGNTRKRAQELAQVTGAELVEIRPAAPYTREDLDWTNRQSRSTVEMGDPASRPKIVGGKVDTASYDVVYIGFPIWWGVAPREINTFLEANDFTGKTIVLFATSGGSGIRKAVQTLQETYPALSIAGGKLTNGRITSDILD